MTNANNEPMILTSWSCSKCGLHQVEAVSEFHEADEQLICSGCLQMTGAESLDSDERTAYLVAMRDCKALEVGNASDS
jgi:hypothetical protein